MIGPSASVKVVVAAIDGLSGEGVTDKVSSILLSDPTVTPRCTWARLRSDRPTLDDVPLVEPTLVDGLLSTFDKKEFERLSLELYPPRTKVDIALRRTRLLDWFKCYRNCKKVDFLREILCTFAAGSDIIYVTNVVAASLIFGEEWWMRWSDMGAFQGGLEHFIAVTKFVHDRVKTSGLDDPHWEEYVECNTLSGYRSLPFPGFEVFGEAKLLADGGNEHDYHGYSWNELVRDFLPMSQHSVEYIPFVEWVKSATWVTAGASSEGRVELSAGGKRVNIKARKNMVADVADLEVIANEAMSNHTQRNITVIKSELGKVRLAVAGDLHTYLKMTWINRLLGGAYYEWPGNTSEESFLQQTDRMSKMLDLCARMFGLPYDYQGFDHQPTTDEIVGIVRHLVKHARLNVPSSGLTEFDLIASSIVDSFYDSDLTTHFDGRKETVKVTGGLMSGLRWTSTVGNAWNSVMTGLMMRILAMWGIDSDHVERFIRGDDSAIFTPNWGTAAAADLAFKQAGAIAGAGKYSVQFHQMEFLRVWYAKRCFGYPVRSIAGLTQRKPWSSAPWSTDMVIRAIYDGIRTIRRRAPRTHEVLAKVWNTHAYIWTRNHNLPRDALRVPTALGGLGVEPTPFGEVLSLSPHIPKADHERSLDVLNMTSRRSDEIAKYAHDRYNLDVSSDADRIARSQFLRTLVADSIPSVSSLVRQEWLRDVRRLHPTISKKVIPVRSDIVDSDLSGLTGDNVREFLSLWHAKAPFFGSHPEIVKAKQDFDDFRIKGGFKQFLRDYYPKVAVDVQAFHSSWHISEIIDYLSGKLTAVTSRLHPALNNVMLKYAATLLLPHKRVERCMSLIICNLVEPILYNSSLSMRVYQW